MQRDMRLAWREEMFAPARPLSTFPQNRGRDSALFNSRKKDEKEEEFNTSWYKIKTRGKNPMETNLCILSILTYFEYYYPTNFDG
mmetsp:Transcript_5402/g.12272  ORF Transcript_5402/g.12272 Transcript_5402/m.12272 type:complete len:85 (-) Transcript_5402:2257-2511(-)